MHIKHKKDREEDEWSNGWEAGIYKTKNDITGSNENSKGWRDELSVSFRWSEKSSARNIRRKL